MKLYSYWRSTTSYRVRAALNLKGVAYETRPIDLLKNEQGAEEYVALNPGGGVPTLVLDDDTVITQSLAIIDYVDTTWPEPRLIPADPIMRARVLAAAHTVALDIHPVNNLRLIGQLKERFGAQAGHIEEWMRHWIALGFKSLEAQLEDRTRFSFGDAPDLADLCIVAQAYNARRWNLDMKRYPKVSRVEAACLALPAIAAAHPDKQPDAKVTT